MVFATQQCKLSSLIFFFKQRPYFSGWVSKICVCVFYLTTGLEKNTHVFSGLVGFEICLILEE